MIEAQIVQALQSMFAASLFGEWVVVFLARVWIFAFAPLLAWLWAYGTNKEKHSVKEALWSLGLAILIGEILSLVFMRERPFLAVSDILVLIPPPLTSSFPSIHTSASVAMASALYAGNKHVGQISLLIVLGIIIGRVAAGVHYPTDILGGIAVGIGAFVLVRLGHRALRRKTKD